MLVFLKASGDGMKLTSSAYIDSIIICTDSNLRSAVVG